MFDDEVVDQVVDNSSTTETQPEQEATVDNVETVQAQPGKKKVSPEESFKAMRDRTAKAERERDEMIRRMSDMEAQKSAAPEEDLEFNLGADELAEGKHLTKVDKKIKKMQQEINQYKQIAEQNAIEVQLKRKYSDFDDIVSEANIAALREEEPEVFETITSSGDLYKKGITAYKMIKKLGIDARDEYKEERQVAEKNLAKPRPLVSGASQRGDTPLSNANAFANGLTKEMKHQLWQEMQDLRRKS